MISYIVHKIAGNQEHWRGDFFLWFLCLWCDSWGTEACSDKEAVNGLMGCLPENLQEIARIRLEYEDMTLKELGEMLEPPIGKSGVNHRLRKIEEIANDLRNKQE